MVQDNVNKKKEFIIHGDNFKEGVATTANFYNTDSGGVMVHGDPVSPEHMQRMKEILEGKTTLKDGTIIAETSIGKIYGDPVTPEAKERMKEILSKQKQRTVIDTPTGKIWGDPVPPEVIQREKERLRNQRQGTVIEIAPGVKIYGDPVGPKVMGNKVEAKSSQVKRQGTVIETPTGKIWGDPVPPGVVGVINSVGDNFAEKKSRPEDKKLGHRNVGLSGTWDVRYLNRNNSNAQVPRVNKTNSSYQTTLKDGSIIAETPIGKIYGDPVTPEARQRAEEQAKARQGTVIETPTGKIFGDPVGLGNIFSLSNLPIIREGGKEDKKEKKLNKTAEIKSEYRGSFERNNVSPSTNSSSSEYKRMTHDEIVEYYRWATDPLPKDLYSITANDIMTGRYYTPDIRDQFIAKHGEPEWKKFQISMINQLNDKIFKREWRPKSKKEYVNYSFLFLSPFKLYENEQRAKYMEKKMKERFDQRMSLMAPLFEKHPLLKEKADKFYGIRFRLRHPLLS